MSFRAQPKLPPVKRSANELSEVRISRVALHSSAGRANGRGEVNEAFKLLRKLIQSTPDSDPAKPDLYYRRECFGNAQARWRRAFAKEEKCLERNRGPQKDNVRVQESKWWPSQINFGTKPFVAIHIAKNFPNYPKLDGALFALAFNYQRKNQSVKAEKIYKTIIQKYPRSSCGRYLTQLSGNFLKPDVFVMPVGCTERSSAVSSAQTPTDMLVKLGWCEYNMGKYMNALSRFSTQLQPLSAW